VNLRLHRALMEHDVSHIYVTGTGTIVREEYTTHSLHLNSRGKMGQLIVECIHDRHVPNRNSGIPVITHARTSPFLG
jgi:hypothetical protein